MRLNETNDDGQAELNPVDPQNKTKRNSLKQGINPNATSRGGGFGATTLGKTKKNDGKMGETRRGSQASLGQTMRGNSMGATKKGPVNPNTTMRG